MKKGQSGERAAALVGIMIVIFVFYIILIPPEDRAQLLGEDVSPGIARDGSDFLENIILSKPIGRVSFLDRQEYDHYIPSITILESKHAQVLAVENDFSIKKGLFSENTKRMIFTLKDVDKIENVILSFQSSVRKGILRIIFNGVPLFEGNIITQNPVPISVPKEIIGVTNTIEFYVVGGFFQKKEYELTDIKVIGDITDREKQVSKNTFKISDVELNNLYHGDLYFYPYCTHDPTLTISLNNRVIYRAVPISDSLNKQEVFKSELVEGRNTLVFEVDKGRCTIERIKIRTVLTPSKTHLEYFNIAENIFDMVLTKNRHVILFIEFVDDGRSKGAVININGFKESIDQKSVKFEKDISKIIKKENNYIELTPKTELNIRKLEIRLE